MTRKNQWVQIKTCRLIRIFVCKTIMIIIIKQTCVFKLHGTTWRTPFLKTHTNSGICQLHRTTSIPWISLTPSQYKFGVFGSKMLLKHTNWSRRTLATFKIRKTGIYGMKTQLCLWKEILTTLSKVILPNAGTSSTLLSRKNSLASTDSGFKPPILMRLFRVSILSTLVSFGTTPGLGYSWKTSSGMELSRCASLKTWR